MNFRQVMAIKSKYRRLLLESNDKLNELPGIYMLTHKKNGIKRAYVGQAKNVIDRLATHFMNYDNQIDFSLRKRKLKTADNDGWEVDFFNCSIKDLDEKEQEMIMLYHRAGYQLLNKTLGGQGEGKTKIVSYGVSGYRKGCEAGKNKAIKELQELLKRVDYSFTAKKNKDGSVNKNSERAVKKIIEILKKY